MEERTDKMNDKDPKTRFQGMFVIGIALMVVGMASGNIGLLGAGVVFLVLGLRAREADTT